MGGASVASAPCVRGRGRAERLAAGADGDNSARRFPVLLILDTTFGELVLSNTEASDSSVDFVKV